MHKFLRSIGFSTYRRKRDIERLLASLVPSAKWRRIQLDEETNLCELRAEVHRHDGGNERRRGISV